MAFIHSHSSSPTIQHCCQSLQAGYDALFPGQSTDSLDLIVHVVNRTLGAIDRSNAPYHDVDHTLQVTLVGHAILQGKRCCEQTVTVEDWLHFMAALLCHDIGYVRGVCRHDQPQHHRYSTGIDAALITLPATATDASLRSVHVDRSKQFVVEQFSDIPLLDIERIQGYIELTRFPVAADPIYQDVLDYPGLARAADLLGQLSDPGYLNKIPALFKEFEETGDHTLMGYDQAKDLRAAYPKFYWNTVSPYIQPGLRYLELTPTGLGILANLYGNLSTVENELMRPGV